MSDSRDEGPARRDFLKTAGLAGAAGLAVGKFAAARTIQGGHVYRLSRTYETGMPIAAGVPAPRRHPRPFP